jgi:ribosomal-protein-alanine N-acetyltransferase
MKPTRPPFSNYPILANEQIILRKSEKTDLQQLVEISFYDGIPAKDEDDAQLMDERITSDYMSGNSIHWIITSTATSEVLGSCGFYRGFENDAGEIGYVLKKSHKGKGHMAEAIKLMLEFGWNELKLKSIFAITAQDNLASKNVLNKTGFKETEVIGNNVKFCIMF